MVNNDKVTKGSNRSEVKSMFNKIASSYDLLNHLLSLGIDIVWRNKALNLVSKKNRDNLLDLGCGTMDLSIMAINKGFSKVTASDFSREMLNAGKLKISKFRPTSKREKFQSQINVVEADAEKLPFESNTFTSCSIGFAIRNFQNRDIALREILRVLKKDSELVIIEFSLPKNIIVRTIYNFYFNHLLPTIGGLISNNYKAYKYLPDSVKRFPSPEDFSDLILDSGFSKVKNLRLSFGIAYIYYAVK